MFHPKTFGIREVVWRKTKEADKGRKRVDRIKEKLWQRR